MTLHSHIHTFTLSYSTPHPTHILTVIITLSYSHPHTIIFHTKPDPHSHCNHHTHISTLSHYHISPHTRPTFSLPSPHSYSHPLTLSYSTPHPAHILTDIITISYPHSHTILFHPTPGPHSHYYHNTLISTLSHYPIPPHLQPTFSLLSSHSHIQTLTL